MTPETRAQVIKAHREQLHKLRCREAKIVARIKHLQREQRVALEARMLGIA